MHEICQFAGRATYWNYGANLRLVGVALPVFGHRCRPSDNAEGGGLACESVSTCGRYCNFWIDLQQFKQSHTSFGIHIENAVTFGMCIAVIAAVAQRQWSGSIVETVAR